MRLHMCGLRLRDFLSGELLCSPSPSTPTQPVITEKTIAAENEVLLANYDDRLASYESQFRAYKTWLDEDARAGLVLVASMENQISTDIVELERSHQMWTSLCSRYEPT
jgi:hypothetical protein